MLVAREMKCRLPHISQCSFGYQADAFFSGYRTEREQDRNEARHCKTVSCEGANENPGALAGATGAERAKKLVLRKHVDTAFLAASHPIIATHWGIGH